MECDLKAYDHNFSDNILKSLETFLTLKEKPSIDTSKLSRLTSLKIFIHNLFKTKNNGQNRKTADEIRLEAEQSIKNLATETTKAEFEKRMKDILSKHDEQLEKELLKKI